MRAFAECECVVVVADFQGGELRLGNHIDVGTVLVFPVWTSAQTLPNPGALDITRYDDGSVETVWKIQNPNGPSDYFSMDMDGDAAGCVVGLLCNTTNFGGATHRGRSVCIRTTWGSTRRATRRTCRC